MEGYKEIEQVLCRSVADIKEILDRVSQLRDLRVVESRPEIDDYLTEVLVQILNSQSYLTICNEKVKRLRDRDQDSASDSMWYSEMDSIDLGYLDVNGQDGIDDYKYFNSLEDKKE